VDSGVDTFNPLAVNFAIITARVGIIGLGELHRFVARVALIAYAFRAR